MEFVGTRRKITRCPNRRLKMQSKAYKAISRRELTKSEKLSALGIIVIVHLAILYTLFGIISLSTSYSATTDVVSNGMVDILSSGVFDSKSGMNSTATSFFTRIAELIFAWALPFMSTFAITMTTISLISSVIYLTKPDTFEEIDQLHQARKGKKFKDMISDARNSGFREFILSICPNFKAYAFSDATQVTENGTPTMQDFLRNIPKYIMIFAFCIVINDRAMLDFIMQGAQVGALVFERITYDYDYVGEVNKFLDEGMNYKPVVWDTKTNEGANKMKVYHKIYNLLKTRITEEADRTTDAKTIMGTKLVNLIDSEAFAGVDWGKDILKINVSYAAIPQGTSVDGVYTVAVSQFLSGDSGVIYANIHTENELKYNVTYTNTTYTDAWGSVPSGSIPSQFDLKRIDELKNETSLTSVNGAMNVTIQYVDSTGATQIKTEQVTISGTTVRIPASGIAASSISSIRLAPAGTLTYTISSANNSSTKSLNIRSAITWKNTSFSPTINQ